MSEKRKRRRRLFFLLLFFLVPLVIFATAEVVMRCYVWARGWSSNCYAADMDLFVPQESRGYELRRGFELRSGVFQMTINADGFRGPRLDRKRGKRNGALPLRIAVLGGSSVFGYLVNDGEEACQLLRERLDELGLPVEVLNGGVPGYNIYQTRDRFEKRIAEYQPDIVILYLGYNDLPYVTSAKPDARQFRVRDGLFAPSWKRRLSPSVFGSFLGNRLGLSSPKPRRHWGSEPSPIGESQFRENYLDLVAIARRENADVFVCTQALAAHPKIDPTLKAFLPTDSEQQAGAIELAKWLHDTIESLAGQTDCQFIDAYVEIPGTAEFLGDDVHLTRKGEERLAELWAEKVNSICTARNP
jgi:lysophospholipase L1-like esterase